LSSEIIRGKVAVQRAYADWRRYPQYIVPLSEASIDLIFAPAFGSNKKNATDIRLAIDAMELVFTRPEIGTIILLSGDSDFSVLEKNDWYVRHSRRILAERAAAGKPHSGEDVGRGGADAYDAEHRGGGEAGVVKRGCVVERC
jgi:hypothetical protein